MTRIPISTTKKLVSIVIGTKKELSKLYGDYVLNDLEDISSRTKIVCSEYKNGEIVYSVL